MEDKFFLNKTSFFEKPVTSVEAFKREELQKAMNFHRSIPGYAPTPLHQLSNLASHLGLQQIYVKDESYRFGLNAFKVLGGAYAMARHIAQSLGEDISKLPYEVITSDKVRSALKEVTFATTTDGNHGRGVAWTANRLKQKSVVYMPKGSTPDRLKAIQDEGAMASIVDMNYDDAVRMTAEQAAEHGWIVVQDTAWEGYEEIPLWIMQGYGTLMLEVLQQLSEVPPTHVFIQAGVGSLAGMMQGMLTALYGADRPKVVVVEAAVADCLYRSANQGKLVAVGGMHDTLMAGLACGEGNTIGWDILRDYSNGFASCQDYVAARGMRISGNPLGSDPRFISGESGAVTLGLVSIIMQSEHWKDIRESLGLDASSRVLCVSTEGDTDPQRYIDIVWDGLAPSYEKF
jgi:diaminopropionate ammonia-lyase